MVTGPPEMTLLWG